MSSIVLLQNIVDALEILPEEWHVFLDLQTGEIVTVTDELNAHEADLSESADHVALPSKYDVHEYKIMENFCYSIKNQDLREDLLNAIDGEGAFRRFKNIIRRRGIADEWYKYRTSALTSIATEWLERHGIAYK